MYMVMHFLATSSAGVSSNRSCCSSAAHGIVGAERERKSSTTSMSYNMHVCMSLCLERNNDDMTLLCCWGVILTSQGRPFFSLGDK